MVSSLNSQAVQRSGIDGIRHFSLGPIELIPQIFLVLGKIVVLDPLTLELKRHRHRHRHGRNKVPVPDCVLERIGIGGNAWLETDGWTITSELYFVDVIAERAGEKLYAEAKGRTTAPGLDIDTAYGQLLRRMPATCRGLAAAWNPPRTGRARGVSSPQV